MSEIKILHCPFCSEELEVVGKGHYFAHKTNGCILQHLCFETDDEEAIKTWNTRKPMQEIVERLEDAKRGFCGGSLQTVYYQNGVIDAIEIVKEVGGMNV